MATLGYIFLGLLVVAVAGVVWYVRMLRNAFNMM